VDVARNASGGLVLAGSTPDGAALVSIDSTTGEKRWNRTLDDEVLGVAERPDRDGWLLTTGDGSPIVVLHNDGSLDHVTYDPDGHPKAPPVSNDRRDADAASLWIALLNRGALLGLTAQVLEPLPSGRYAVGHAETPGAPRKPSLTLYGSTGEGLGWLSSSSGVCDLEALRDSRLAVLETGEAGSSVSVIPTIPPDARASSRVVDSNAENGTVTLELDASESFSPPGIVEYRWEPSSGRTASG